MSPIQSVFYFYKYKILEPHIYFSDYLIIFSPILGCITPLAAASLLAFCLLYTPCVAAIASVRRELGGKWAVGVVIGQCVIAWAVAFVVHLVGGFFF